MNAAAPSNRSNRSPDEIDLRGVINALLAGKKLILVVTILAGFAAFGVSVVRPKQYEAVSQVAITQPVFMPVLSTSILLATNPPAVSVNPRLPDVKALKDLALADDLLFEVAGVTRVTKGTSTFDIVAPSSTQLRLSVTDTDPKRAADLANRWGEAIAHRLNDLIGVDDTDLTKLQTQLTDADATWQKLSQSIDEVARSNRFNASGTESEAVRYQLARLNAQRDVAFSAYQALSRQVQEVRIFLAENGNTARVFAKAVVPEEPVGPHPKLNAALGAVLGLMLSIFYVLARAWWREPVNA